MEEKVIKDFLDELEALYHKYNLSLGHEDSQGAFIIEKFYEDNIQWVRAARRDTLKEGEE